MNVFQECREGSALPGRKGELVPQVGVAESSQGAACGVHGYLAHKKTPTPLGPP